MKRFWMSLSLTAILGAIPAFAGESGQLALNTSPEPTEVYIDGKKIFDRFGALEMLAGKYKIEVKKNGFETKTFDILVVPDAVVTVSIALLAEKPSRKEIQNAEGMVEVPAGCFMMGLTDGEPSSSPAHQVCLDGFYMDKLETTQNDFEKTMKNNLSHFKGGDLPAENVSWYEAVEYCRKMGKRLPTEAEWEYAARAGTTTKYHWGDNGKEADNYGWFSGNAEEKTHPVGQKQPNAWGMYDMSGNVWEWVADWFNRDYYKISPRDNPKGAAGGEFRVLRGGSWGLGVSNMRPSFRFRTDPADRSITHGFRCAR